jgi:hypothetical protein
MTYDPRTDFPRWDESHVTTLTSTDEVFVETDVQPTDDGTHLEIRRTVWKIAYRRKDRDILWTGTVALIPREQVPAFTRDIVSSLV